MKSSPEERILRLLAAVHPLDRIPRAGYLLRGVPEPETVAAHLFSLALLTLAIVEQYPALFNTEKALALALLHDLGESQLMDIPSPAGDAAFRDARRAAENAVLGRLLEGLSGSFAEWREELASGDSPELRLIKGLDKVQMMVKVAMYQQEGKGRLDEFWENAGNFEDHGVEPVRRMFDAVCAWAGRKRPAAAS